MAFDPTSFSSLAQTLAGGVLRIYAYGTSDSSATVSGADYFTNIAKFGAREGDLVVVIGGDTDLLLTFTTITAAGHGTAGSTDSSSTTVAPETNNTQTATTAFVHSVAQPTLRGYFGVNPASEEQAITRIQDAARSGMTVFIDPGEYKLDPDHPLEFDGEATIFRGAGPGLVNFTSVDFDLTGNLISVSAGGCGLEGFTITGEEFFDGGTPNTDTLVYVTSTDDTPMDFFLARDLRLIGGINGLALAQTRKAYLYNIYCAEQTGHGLSFQTNSLIDLNIDGVVCRRILSEGISLSDFPSSVSASEIEAGGRVIIRNYMAFNTATALDAFLTTTRLVTIDNLIVDRCRGGAVEIKAMYDDDNPVTNPNEGAQLISISNVKMRNDADGGTVGNGAITLDWGVGTPHGANPGTVQSKIEIHDVTVDYDSNVLSSSPVISLKGQVDVGVYGLRVSGSASAMFQLSTGNNAGVGAVATRIDLSGLTTVGDSVISGVLINTTGGVDQINLRNSNIKTTASPVRLDVTYVKEMTIDGCTLESTTNGRPVHLTSSVVELNVNGSYFKPFDYGVYCSTYASTPTLAALPNVSTCVDSGGLVRVTFASAHGLATDDAVSIASVVGTTEANGIWLVTVVDTTKVTLQESAFSNAYVSGGTVRRASKLEFDNTLFRKGTGDAIRVDHDLYLTAFGCRCNVASDKTGVNDQSSNSKIRAQMFRGFLASAPTSTAGSANDYFLSYAPASGGTPGWVCTTAGDASGAAWKAMAVLA